MRIHAMRRLARPLVPLALSASFLSLAGIGPVSAGQSQGTLTVRVQVVASCGAGGASCPSAPAALSAPPGTPPPTEAQQGGYAVIQEQPGGTTYRTVVY